MPAPASTPAPPVASTPLEKLGEDDGDGLDLEEEQKTTALRKDTAVDVIADLSQFSWKQRAQEELKKKKQKQKRSGKRRSPDIGHRMPDFALVLKKTEEVLHYGLKCLNF
jgi:hypothetical protein